MYKIIKMFLLGIMLMLISLVCLKEYYKSDSYHENRKEFIVDNLDLIIKDSNEYSDGYFYNIHLGNKGYYDELIIKKYNGVFHIIFWANRKNINTFLGRAKWVFIKDTDFDLDAGKELDSMIIKKLESL